MLTEVEALIGGIDNDGVVGDAFFFEVFKDGTDAVIDRFDASEVVVHVTLVTPPHEVLALEIGLEKGFIARAIVGFPLGLLLRRELARSDEFHISGRDGLLQRHVLIAHGHATVLIVIEESRGLRILAVVVMAQITDRRLPFAMGRFVLAHHEEGLGLVAALEPFDGLVSDDVSDVAFVLDGGAHLDGRRIVIHALAGEDVPVIKALGIGHEMPFANDSGLVASRLHDLREGLLGAIELAVRVVVETVEVVVFARLNHCAARAADGVRHEAAVKDHAFLRQPVDVRRFVELPFLLVGTDGLISMIVGEDENDVGRSLGSGGASHRQGSKRHSQGMNESAGKNHEPWERRALAAPCAEMKKPTDAEASGLEQSDGLAHHFFSKSRISVSNTTSAGTGAGSAGFSSSFFLAICWSLFSGLMMPKNTTAAMMRNPTRALMKFPIMMPPSRISLPSFIRTEWVLGSTALWANKAMPEKSG